MPKRIPYIIKRNDDGFGQFDVTTETGEFVHAFPSRSAARDFIINGVRRDEDGEFEFDPEQDFDEERAIQQAEIAYDGYLDRIGRH